MKQQLLLTLVCYAFYFMPAAAQRQNVYFLKNSGKFIDKVDSADYVRIVKEPDSGSVLYNVTEYYKNARIKMIGKTSIVEDLRLEGQYIRFYPTGKKQEMGTYKSGILFGDVNYYYPNGKLYAIIEHRGNQWDLKHPLIIKTCNDSTGRPLVVDSNGHFILFNSKFNKILTEGNVKHGLKEGNWELFLGTDTGAVIYKRTYKYGELVPGQSESQIHASSKDSVNYSDELTAVGGLSSIGEGWFEPTIVHVDIPPQFNGGENAFARFLSSHVRYPGTAVKNGIQGRVYVEFVVEKDGSLTDIKIVRDPGSGLGDEAVRVMSLSPRWVPGIQNGRPVRVLFTVPINFSLNDK